MSFMHNVKFDAVKDCHCGVEMPYNGCDYTFSDPALHQAIVKMQAEGKHESNRADEVTSSVAEYFPTPKLDSSVTFLEVSARLSEPLVPALVVTVDNVTIVHISSFLPHHDLPMALAVCCHFSDVLTQACIFLVFCISRLSRLLAMWANVGDNASQPEGAIIYAL